MHVVGKLAIAVGLVGGGALVLRSCDDAPTAERVAKNMLRDVDRNDDDALDKAEASYSGMRYLDGAMHVESVQGTKLLEATDADGNDRATVAEIAAHLLTVDANGNERIERSELRELPDLWPSVRLARLGG